MQQTKLCSFKELQKEMHVKYAKKAFSQKKGNSSILVLENHKPKNGISHQEYKQRIKDQHEKLQRNTGKYDHLIANNNSYTYEKTIVEPLNRIFHHILNSRQSMEKSLAISIRKIQNERRNLMAQKAI